jgi:hypothetical protein
MPGGTNDPSYVSGAGVGGAGGTNMGPGQPGGPGLVVLICTG